MSEGGALKRTSLIYVMSELQPAEASAPLTIRSSMAQLAEPATKIATLLGFLALGSAFLYDFVFWTSIDRRMISYLVVADHIETAVSALALIILAAGLLYLYQYGIRWRRPQKYEKSGPTPVGWKILLGATGVIGAVGPFVLKLPEPLLLSLTTTAAFTAVIMALARSLVMRASALFCLWLASISVVAIWESTVTIDGARKHLDAIEIESSVGPRYQYSIYGHVIRWIDRGAVIIDDKQQITFVPKEHIFRVDHHLADPQTDR
jgi:hypothetical protein